MFIQNVPLSAIPTGFHYDAGQNSMLIQICDPGHQFPVPVKEFKETHQFEFLDVETENDLGWEFRPTQEQADRIVELLSHAKQNRMNVIVHCHAGLCRSGAVAEIGVIIGFEDTKTLRLPNTYLKGMMMKTLGISYDSDEEHKSRFSWLFDY